MNKYELIESFFIFTFLYLLLMIFGVITSPETFPAFSAVITPFYVAPFFLIIFIKAVTPLVEYINKYGVRIVDEPLDAVSFAMILIFAPLISMVVFGIIYTIASVYVSFLPYPSAFQ